MDDARPRAARRRTLDDRDLPDPNDPLIAHLMSNEGKTRSEALQIMLVQSRGGPVIEAARALLGDRLAEARFSDGAGVLLYILDPTDDDRKAVAALARRGGIDGRVTVERFRPEWIAIWDELRADLVRLQQHEPSPLRAYPGPETPFRMPPHHIQLSGAGGAVAADWHRRFGANVELRVGAQPYPPAQVGSATGSATVRSGERMDLAEFKVALDGELSIASGQSRDHGIWLLNRVRPTVTVHSNGHLRASIVDPITGNVVGASSGPSRLVLHRRTLPPGQPVRMPAWISTDSIDPDLGYAVPPGQWDLVIHIQLADGRRLDSPPLPMRVT